MATPRMSLPFCTLWYAFASIGVTSMLAASTLSSSDVLYTARPAVALITVGALLRPALGQHCVNVAPGAQPGYRLAGKPSTSPRPPGP